MNTGLLSLLFVSVAHANVVGLPAELNGANEEAIEYSAVNELAERNGCTLTAKQVRAVQATSKFTITKSKKQPKANAEYPGELSSFTLKTTSTLGLECSRGGTWTCLMHFDLYDVRSYAVDASKTVCKAGK